MKKKRKKVEWNLAFQKSHSQYLIKKENTALELYSKHFHVRNLHLLPFDQIRKFQENIKYLKEYNKGLHMQVLYQNRLPVQSLGQP